METAGNTVREIDPTGQCGGDVIEGMFHSYPASRHVLCRLAQPNGKGWVCGCGCHAGQAPWETPTPASIAPARKMTRKPSANGK
jgi:hypothetical protein